MSIWEVVYFIGDKKKYWKKYLNILGWYKCWKREIGINCRLIYFNILIYNDKSINTWFEELINSNWSILFRLCVKYHQVWEYLLKFCNFTRTIEFIITWKTEWTRIFRRSNAEVDRIRWNPWQSRSLRFNRQF